MKYKVLTFILFILFSCENNKIKNNTDIKNPVIEVIKVPKFEATGKLPLEDLFSSVRYVPLETNKNSLISEISRIYVFNNRFYILDKQTNSVLIFNNGGKFLEIIQNIGNGPGEYTGLQDFAIDEKNSRLILYAHRPYKMLYYDLNGKYLHEKAYNDLYHFISYSDGKLFIYSHRVKKDNNMLISEDENTKKRISSLPIPKYGKRFENIRTNFPYIIKSQNIYISFPYCDTLFSVAKGRAFPKYYVDFIDNEMPESLFEKHESANDVFMAASENDYGFKISNTRENKDYIYFTYGSGINVIYSKKKKTVVSFKSIDNKQTHEIVGNYWGHDGADDNLISVITAADLKFMSNYIKKDSAKWNMIPEDEDIKVLDKVLEEDSNPILQIYTFKDEE